MRTLQTISLKVVDYESWILDKQALPQQQNWLQVGNLQNLIRYLQQLKVRGAPLIDITASLFLALQAGKGASLNSIKPH